jgi:hypothetical protein
MDCDRHLFCADPRRVSARHEFRIAYYSSSTFVLECKSDRLNYFNQLGILPRCFHHFDCALDLSISLIETIISGVFVSAIFFILY